MRVRAYGDGTTTELPVPGHDRRGGVHLIRGLSQAARIDLESRPTPDQRHEDPLVQLGSRRQVRRRNVRNQVALDEVDMADGVEKTYVQGIVTDPAIGIAAEIEAVFS